MNAVDLAAMERREFARVAALMQKSNAIFVFGSNRAGIHGAGAAKEAERRHGAVYGVGEGLSGRSYALPTKDEHFQTLSLEAIADHIANLGSCARRHPQFVFAVTRIGCGIAGYTDYDIAPLCQALPDNCELPEGWR